MNTRIPVSIDGVVPWPDEIAAGYRKAGYWQGRSLASFISDEVARRPDDEAVIDGAHRLTYQQLWDRAASCAQALIDLNIAAGDRILLQLPNCWEFIALTLGCLRVGVVPVRTHPPGRPFRSGGDRGGRYRP
jgi:2,3-dihydroxybenzoate-AMP ligase